MDITYIRGRSKSGFTRVVSRGFALAIGCFRDFRRSKLWKSLLRSAVSRRKSLSIRETAALGDRRFVSVIQFERRRFLIGSSPSSVTLLSHLPDEPGSDEPGSNDLVCNDLVNHDRCRKIAPFAEDGTDA